MRLVAWWAEGEARRRGLHDPEYVRYREAEGKVEQALRRVDEQVAEMGRRRVLPIRYED